MISLIQSTAHATALSLIQDERDHCAMLSALADPSSKKPADSAIKYLDYLSSTWMPVDLWTGWSQHGRRIAAMKMGVPIDKVLTTTNHIESLNSSLKGKHITQWQHSGHRLRFDVLLYHLTVHILPRIYARHRMLAGYAAWKSERFKLAPSGRCASTKPSSKPYPRAWYAPDQKRDAEAEIILKLVKLDLISSKREYEYWATCKSSDGHTSYSLTLHPTGAATCTCPDWQFRGGACKHLRAFRSVAETWIAECLVDVPFCFPKTAEEAAAIESANQRWYGDRYSDAVTLPSSAPLGPLGPVDSLERDTEILPPYVLDEVSPAEGQINQEIAMAEAVLATGDGLDIQAGAQVNSHSLNAHEQSTLRAVALQTQQQVEHDILKILPTLHGLLNTISSPEVTLKPTAAVLEFEQVITAFKLQVPTKCHLNMLDSSGKPQALQQGELV